MKNLVIICAACKADDIILCGARHWDKIMLSQYRAIFHPPHSAKFQQGFINQFGVFYTREEAMEVVKSYKQSFDSERNGENTLALYSEGLY